MCLGQADKQLSRRTQHHTGCARTGLQAAELWEDNAVGGAGEMDVEIPQSPLIILEHRGECRQKALKQNFWQRVRNHSC